MFSLNNLVKKRNGYSFKIHSSYTELRKCEQQKVEIDNAIGIIYSVIAIIYGT